MAQQGQQGGQGGAGNESLDFLWLVVVAVVASFAIWYFYRNEITSFIFAVRLYEVKLLRFFLEFLQKGFAAVNLPFFDLSDLNKWEHFIQGKPGEVAFSSLEEVSAEIGKYIKYPVIVILGGLGFFIYRKHVALKFKTIFTMLTLKKAEQIVWPQSKPTLSKNLVAEDLKKGPWAMAMTTIDFCEKHKIIKSVVKEGNSIGKLIKGPAYRVFALQTGRLWGGPQSLKPHVKALFAIFAAKANHENEAANKLLDQISSSSGSGKLNFDGVSELFNKHYPSKLVQRIIARHAYLLTVMASMLQLARTDGVLASAEFIWLKPIDRPLWYILNSVGRRVAVPEIAGAFAHWLAEIELGAPIRTPMVDSAVKALETELENTLYNPEAEE